MLNNLKWKYKCPNCGGKMKYSFTKSCRKCFFLLRRKENHPLWKGGKRSVLHGYVEIKCDHPMMTKKGYVREHRLIVEKILGRFLSREEVIHHINLDETDNRPENLYLFKSNIEHMRYHRLSKFGKIEKINKSNII